MSRVSTTEVTSRGPVVSSIFRAPLTALTIALPPTKGEGGFVCGCPCVVTHGPPTAVSHMSFTVVTTATICTSGGDIAMVDTPNRSVMYRSLNTSPPSAPTAPVVLPPGVPETMTFLRTANKIDVKVDLKGPVGTPPTVSMSASALPLRMGLTAGLASTKLILGEPRSLTAMTSVPLAVPVSLPMTPVPPFLTSKKSFKSGGRSNLAKAASGPTEAVSGTKPSLAVD